jgi:hypothetical protein
VLFLSHYMTFAQRRNRLTTHFSERIPVVKRRMSLLLHHLRRSCRPLKFANSSFAIRYVWRADKQLKGSVLVITILLISGQAVRTDVAPTSQSCYSQVVKVPRLHDNDTGWWYGCQPHAPAAFTPRKCSWYLFLLEAESTPGP